LKPRDRKFQFRKTNTHHVTHTSGSSHATSFIETVAVELMSSNWCLVHILFEPDISTLEVFVERNDTLYVEFIFDILCPVYLYSTPNTVRVVKSRRMRWAGQVARMGEGRGVHSVLVGKPEGKRPLGRPRRRWEDDIKMDLQELRGGFGDWMELAQVRDMWRALVCTVRNLRVPKMRGIF